MNVKRKPAKAERPTSKMRALFREAAREIVARDREARKGGRTQNTIGEIERAMVKAYVCGQEALLNKREGPSALLGHRFTVGIETRQSPFKFLTCLCSNACVWRSTNFA